MERSIMLYSNCRIAKYCPPFLHLRGTPTLLSSLPFIKLIQYHRFQKTSPSSTKTTQIPHSLRTSPTRCSLDDQPPGLTTKVTESDPSLAVKVTESDPSLAVKVTESDPSLAVKNKAAEITSELRGTSIFLVGMSSAMKTNLGKVLADALRYYYFDSDSLVEQALGGESGTKSFRESDEKGFRESETEVLKQLSSMVRLVVCTGDGAVQSSTNLAFLRHGVSIWIDVPLDVLAREIIESGPTIPTSDSAEVLSKLTELYKRMREEYAIADATVSLQKVAYQLDYDSMDRVTVEDMALQTLKEIEKLTRVKKMMEAAARPF